MNMIKGCRENLGWEFIFIGAQEDAIEVGLSLGMRMGTVVINSCSKKGLVEKYSVVSNRASQYRSDGVVTDFTDKERKAVNED